MTWLTRYGIQLLLYMSDCYVAGHQVFKVSSQYHQEIKQKAKHVVEKDFLHVKVSDWGHDSKRLNAAARAEKLAKATEARIKCPSTVRPWRSSWPVSGGLEQTPRECIRRTRRGLTSANHYPAT